jgi:hypothetical protein
MSALGTKRTSGGSAEMSTYGNPSDNATRCTYPQTGCPNFLTAIRSFLSCIRKVKPIHDF